MTVLKLDGVEYDISDLSDNGKAQLASLQFTQAELDRRINMHALLIKARKAYMADLKDEMVQSRTGIDFGDLFSDD